MRFHRIWKQDLLLPTQTEGDDPKVGYITFTDQLGEYMQVDEFKSFGLCRSDIRSGRGELVTEKRCYYINMEGSATGDTELYPNGNVKDIIVQGEERGRP